MIPRPIIPTVADCLLQSADRMDPLREKREARESAAREEAFYRESGESGDKATDMVNEPPHYKAGGIECIDAIEAALTPEEFRGYCKGNALKYVWRERHKGGAESVAKASWYLTRAVQAHRRALLK